MDLDPPRRIYKQPMDTTTETTPTGAPARGTRNPNATSRLQTIE